MQLLDFPVHELPQNIIPNDSYRSPGWCNFMEFVKLKIAVKSASVDVEG
jgi:hypothetical protein